MPLARFYFRDGHVETRKVQPCRGEDLPRNYILTVMIAQAVPSLFDPIPAAVRVGFERRDYRYPPDFIGPHRQSDYHEA